MGQLTEGVDQVTQAAVDALNEYADGTKLKSIQLTKNSVVIDGEQSAKIVINRPDKPKPLGQ